MVTDGRSMENKMFYVNKIADLLNVNKSVAYDIYNRMCIGGADFSEMSKEQFEREVSMNFMARNHALVSFLIKLENGEVL